jgi:hypothetical protein
MNRHFVSFTASLSLAAMLLCVPYASAQLAGYDLLQTTSDASIDLSPRPSPGFPGISGLTPSTIPLRGVPICACTGAADTIMHRGDRVLPSGTAALTVVALFLKNSGRVTLGKTEVDVYITVNNSSGMIGHDTVPQPDRLAPSTGTLTIRTDGTFDSAFTVNADVIVVAAGADVRNPATTVLAHRAGPAVHLGAPGSTWSATPPPDYPKCFFPANGFYPGGPVPETDPTNPLHRHPVAPSSPVTATLTVTPTTYTGHCPAPTFHFAGTITAPAGMTGTYEIIRNDGGHSGTPQTFSGPSTSVTNEWTGLSLGPTDPNPYHGWVAIRILTPGVVESNHATFILTCTP